MLPHTDVIPKTMIHDDIGHQINPRSLADHQRGLMREFSSSRSSTSSRDVSQPRPHEQKRALESHSSYGHETAVPPPPPLEQFYFAQTGPPSHPQPSLLVFGGMPWSAGSTPFTEGSRAAQEDRPRRKKGTRKNRSDRTAESSSAMSGTQPLPSAQTQNRSSSRSSSSSNSFHRSEERDVRGGQSGTPPPPSTTHRITSGGTGYPTHPLSTQPRRAAGGAFDLSSPVRLQGGWQSTDAMTSAAPPPQTTAPSRHTAASLSKRGEQQPPLADSRGGGAEDPPMYARRSGSGAAGRLPRESEAEQHSSPPRYEMEETDVVRRGSSTSALGGLAGRALAGPRAASRPAGAAVTRASSTSTQSPLPSTPPARARSPSGGAAVSTDGGEVARVSTSGSPEVLLMHQRTPAEAAAAAAAGGGLNASVFQTRVVLPQRHADPSAHTTANRRDSATATGTSAEGIPMVHPSSSAAVAAGPLLSSPSPGGCGWPSTSASANFSAVRASSLFPYGTSSTLSIVRQASARGNPNASGTGSSQRQRSVSFQPTILPSASAFSPLPSPPSSSFSYLTPPHEPQHPAQEPQQAVAVERGVAALSPVPSSTALSSSEQLPPPPFTSLSLQRPSPQATMGGNTAPRSAAIRMEGVSPAELPLWKGGVRAATPRRAGDESSRSKREEASGDRHQRSLGGVSMPPSSQPASLPPPPPLLQHQQQLVSGGAPSQAFNGKHDSRKTAPQSGHSERPASSSSSVSSSSIGSSRSSTRTSSSRNHSSSRSTSVCSSATSSATGSSTAPQRRTQKRAALVKSRRQRTDDPRQHSTPTPAPQGSGPPPTARSGGLAMELSVLSDGANYPTHPKAFMVAPPVANLNAVSEEELLLRQRDRIHELVHAQHRQANVQRTLEEQWREAVQHSEAAVAQARWSAAELRRTTAALDRQKSARRIAERRLQAQKSAWESERAHLEAALEQARQEHQLAEGTWKSDRERREAAQAAALQAARTEAAANAEATFFAHMTERDEQWQRHSEGLRGQLQMLKAELEDVQQAHQTLLEDRTKLRREVQQLQKALDDNQAHCTQTVIPQAIKEAETKMMEVVRVQEKSMVEKEGQLEAQRGQLEASKLQWQQQAEKAQAALAQAEFKIKGLQESLQERDATVEDLRAQVFHHRRAQRRREDTAESNEAQLLREAELRAEKLEAEVRRAQKDLREQGEQAKERLQFEQVQARQREASLGVEVEDAVRRHHRLDMALQQALQKVQENTEALTKREEMLQAQTLEVHRERRARETVVDQLHAKEDALRRVEEEREHLRREKSVVASQLKHLQVRSAAQEKELSGYRAALWSLQARVFPGSRTLGSGAGALPAPPSQTRRNPPHGTLLPPQYPAAAFWSSAGFMDPDQFLLGGAAEAEVVEEVVDALSIGRQTSPAATGTTGGRSLSRSQPPAPPKQQPPSRTKESPSGLLRSPELEGGSRPHRRRRRDSLHQDPSSDVTKRGSGRHTRNSKATRKRVKQHSTSHRRHPSEEQQSSVNREMKEDDESSTTSRSHSSVGSSASSSRSGSWNGKFSSTSSSDSDDDDDHQHHHPGQPPQNDDHSQRRGGGGGRPTSSPSATAPHPSSTAPNGDRTASTSAQKLKARPEKMSLPEQNSVGQRKRGKREEREGRVSRGGHQYNVTPSPQRNHAISPKPVRTTSRHTTRKEEEPARHGRKWKQDAVPLSKCEEASPPTINSIVKAAGASARRERSGSPTLLFPRAAQNFTVTAGGDAPSEGVEANHMKIQQHHLATGGGTATVASAANHHSSTSATAAVAASSSALNRSAQGVPWTAVRPSGAAPRGSDAASTVGGVGRSRPGAPFSAHTWEWNPPLEECFDDPFVLLTKSVEQELQHHQEQEQEQEGKDEEQQQRSRLRQNQPSSANSDWRTSTDRGAQNQEETLLCGPTVGTIGSTTTLMRNCTGGSRQQRDQQQQQQQQQEPDRQQHPSSAASSARLRLSGGPPAQQSQSGFEDCHESDPPRSQHSSHSHFRHKHRHPPTILDKGGGTVAEGAVLSEMFVRWIQHFQHQEQDLRAFSETTVESQEGEVAEPLHAAEEENRQGRREVGGTRSGPPLLRQNNIASLQQGLPDQPPHQWQSRTTTAPQPSTKAAVLLAKRRRNPSSRDSSRHRSAGFHLHAQPPSSPHQPEGAPLTSTTGVNSFSLSTVTPTPGSSAMHSAVGGVKDLISSNYRNAALPMTKMNAAVLKSQLVPETTSAVSASTNEATPVLGATNTSPPSHHCVDRVTPERDAVMQSRLTPPDRRTPPWSLAGGFTLPEATESSAGRKHSSPQPPPLQLPRANLMDSHSFGAWSVNGNGASNHHLQNTSLQYPSVSSLSPDGVGPVSFSMAMEGGTAEEERRFSYEAHQSHSSPVGVSATTVLGKESQKQHESREAASSNLSFRTPSPPAPETNISATGEEKGVASKEGPALTTGILMKNTAAAGGWKEGVGRGAPEAKEGGHPPPRYTEYDHPYTPEPQFSSTTAPVAAGAPRDAVKPVVSMNSNNSNKDGLVHISSLVSTSSWGPSQDLFGPPVAAAPLNAVSSVGGYGYPTRQGPPIKKSSYAMEFQGSISTAIAEGVEGGRSAVHVTEWLPPSSQMFIGASFPALGGSAESMFFRPSHPCPHYPPTQSRGSTSLSDSDPSREFSFEDDEEDGAMRHRPHSHQNGARSPLPHRDGDQRCHPEDPCPHSEQWNTSLTTAESHSALVVVAAQQAAANAATVMALSSTSGVLHSLSNSLDVAMERYVLQRQQQQLRRPLLHKESTASVSEWRRNAGEERDTPQPPHAGTRGGDERGKVVTLGELLQHPPPPQQHPGQTSSAAAGGGVRSPSGGAGTTNSSASHRQPPAPPSYRMGTMDSFSLTTDSGAAEFPLWLEGTAAPGVIRLSGSGAPQPHHAGTGQPPQGWSSASSRSASPKGYGAQHVPGPEPPLPTRPDPLHGMRQTTETETEEVTAGVTGSPPPLPPSLKSPTTRKETVARAALSTEALQLPPPPPLPSSTFAGGGSRSFTAGGGDGFQPMRLLHTAADTPRASSTTASSPHALFPHQTQSEVGLPLPMSDAGDGASAPPHTGNGETGTPVPLPEIAGIAREGNGSKTMTASPGEPPPALPLHHFSHSNPPQQHPSAHSPSRPLPRPAATPHSLSHADSGRVGEGSRREVGEPELGGSLSSGATGGSAGGWLRSPVSGGPPQSRWAGNGEEGPPPPHACLPPPSASHQPNANNNTANHHMVEGSTSFGWFPASCTPIRSPAVPDRPAATPVPDVQLHGSSAPTAGGGGGDGRSNGAMATADEASESSDADNTEEESPEASTHRMPLATRENPAEETELRLPLLRNSPSPILNSPNPHSPTDPLPRHHHPDPSGGAGLANPNWNSLNNSGIEAGSLSQYSLQLLMAGQHTRTATSTSIATNTAANTGIQTTLLSSTAALGSGGGGRSSSVPLDPHRPSNFLYATSGIPRRPSSSSFLKTMPAARSHDGFSPVGLTTPRSTSAAASTPTPHHPDVSASGGDEGAETAGDRDEERLYDGMTWSAASAENRGHHAGTSLSSLQQEIAPDIRGSGEEEGGSATPLPAIRSRLDTLQEAFTTPFASTQRYSPTAFLTTSA